MDATSLHQVPILVILISLLCNHLIAEAAETIGIFCTFDDAVGVLTWRLTASVIGQGWALARLPQTTVFRCVKAEMFSFVNDAICIHALR